jgi:hypothetical protein
MECHAVQSGTYVSAFRRNILPDCTASHPRTGNLQCYHSEKIISHFGFIRLG